MSTSVSLSVEDLTVVLPDGSAAVEGLSLTLRPGQIHALVGPSGSGKSLTARALAGLLPPGVRAQGRALVTGPDGRSHPLIGPHAERAERLRGAALSYVPQQTATALHPGRTLGAQARAVLRAHGRREGWPEAARDAVRWAGLVLDGGRDPLRSYAHQLSGGQRQRAVLALAELCRPWVSIPDEVTTGLDPATRTALLRAIRERADTRARAVLLITHDLGVVERWADHVTVLCDGEAVESGTVDRVVHHPRHPFTRRLLADRPESTSPGPAHPADTAGTAAAAVATPPPRATAPSHAPGRGRPPRSQAGTARTPERVLTAEHLRVVHAPRGRRHSPVTALDDISLTLVRGEAVAVVGASGCGKSTLLSCLAQHQRPTTGLVRRHLPESAGPAPVQLLFQDAVSSFNPRWTVGQVIAEALRYRPHAQADAAAPIVRLLHDVGLAPRTAGLRPAELSGGQAQRVALARALAAAPAVLLCDEPTTNLDVTAQAQILRLLARLRAEHHLTSVFVTHDMALVPHVADRVLVMAEGRVVEDLPAAALRDTRHPTTRRLLSGT